MVGETGSVQPGSLDSGLQQDGFQRVLNNRDLHPDTAIEFGYMLYLADNAEGGHLKDVAVATVERLKKVLTSFEPSTPMGFYTTKLLSAGGGLARGIASKKKLQNARLEAAEQKRVDMIARVIKGQRSIGLLKAAFRLILLGGFGYALVQAIFQIPSIENKAIGVDARFASIATALGLALIGSFVSSSITTWRIVNIFREYDLAISRATEDYHCSVEHEYRFAAEEASLAWKGLTGEAAPMTGGFRDLLIAVARGGSRRSGMTVGQQNPRIRLRTWLRCLVRTDIRKFFDEMWAAQEKADDAEAEVQPPEKGANEESGARQDKTMT